MDGLQACIFKYITVAAFMLSVVKIPLKGRLDAMHYILIVMEITLLIVKNHGKFMELCF